MSEITDLTYWEDGYRQKQAISPSPSEGNENFCEEQLLNLIRAVGLDGKRVLEIGGGGSAILARLSIDYPNTHFTCLDYSEEGCALIRDFAAERSASNLVAVVSDFRTPPADLGKFDVVYSLGVVEHFTNLPEILEIFSGYLRPDGKMITSIPNMSGLLGFLTKLMNRKVYDIHVPHDKNSFLRGHVDAGLNIITCKYLGSTNFGVLSSCVTPTRRVMWQVYLWLSRLSKLGFIFERKFGHLPTTRLLSPYIVAISETR